MFICTCTHHLDKGNIRKQGRPTQTTLTYINMTEVSGNNVVKAQGKVKAPMLVETQGASRRHKEKRAPNSARRIF